MEHFTCQIDDDRDHLDHLQYALWMPLWDVVQDLYIEGADPSLKTPVKSCRSYGSHPVAWARPYRSSLKYVDRQVGIDHLSDMWNV